MAQKKTQKKTSVNSGTPALPSSIRMTKRQKQKLNRRVIFLTLILIFNVGLTFGYGHSIESILKQGFSFMDRAETTQTTDAKNNAQKPHFNALRGIIITQTEGFSIPSIYGNTLTTLEEGDEVSLIKQEGDWWQVRTEHDQTAWIEANTLLTN